MTLDVQGPFRPEGISRAQNFDLRQTVQQPLCKSFRFWTGIEPLAKVEHLLIRKIDKPMNPGLISRSGSVFLGWGFRHIGARVCLKSIVGATIQGPVDALREALRVLMPGQL